MEGVYRLAYCFGLEYKGPIVRSRLFSLILKSLSLSASSVSTALFSSEDLSESLLWILASLVCDLEEEYVFGDSNNGEPIRQGIVLTD